MGRKKPERETVEKILKENDRRQAHDIAGEAGLIDTMGYDRAVDYVRRVKRELREKGHLQPHPGRFATDAERLADITRLFELRKGKMSSRAAYTMLLLNCYYRLRSEDDAVHLRAIDDTYEKNRELEKPFALGDAVHICEIALTQYTRSIDEELNREARERGFPGAGLNYTSESLVIKCEITGEELDHMTSIGRG